MERDPEKDDKVIRVGLATPPGALRAGLRSLLTSSSRIQVTLEAPALSDLDRLPAAVDVMVTTAGTARSSRQPLDASIPVLLLVTETSFDLDGLKKISPLAWGVLPLDADAETLQAAVVALYEGLIVVPPLLLDSLFNKPQPLPASNESGETEPLTQRETEVLQQLALGLTNKQIARALGISEHTVKFHISAIYGKLGVMNRAEAVHAGIRRGWIEI
jgi:DNA-binding NarL/FixJ family response regulator